MTDAQDNKPSSDAEGIAGGTQSPIPAGKLEVVITYLEMRQQPTSLSIKPPTEGLTIVHAKRPTISFYRYLYNGVGQPWLWHERRQMSDESLRAIIQDPRVEVYVLCANGVPAGYVELDRRINDDVEVAYFGLMPGFIGRGLGQYLLDWAVIQAWRKQPKRVWVHTCNLDHPKALEVYRRAGFVSYQQKTTLIDDPRIESRESGV